MINSWGLEYYENRIEHMLLRLATHIDMKTKGSEALHSAARIMSMHDLKWREHSKWKNFLFIFFINMVNLTFFHIITKILAYKLCMEF